MTRLRKSDKGMQRGFTMVELIMTMVIIGIIAAVAVPRFFESNVFQSRGFADQVLASLRYAQKVAIAQNRNVCVVFAVDSVTLTIASANGAASPCNTPLGMATGAPNIAAPAGVAFTALPANFNFNALGTPSIAAPLVIGITGAANAITVEPGTGYVHSP